MMSLSFSNEPISKVYSTLNIIDEYQKSDKSQQLSNFSETMSTLNKSTDEELKASQVILNNFTITPVDKGNLTTKYDLSYQSHVWIMSKNQKEVNSYLKSIEKSKETELNTVNSNPSFTTLLFFDFFKKVDTFSGLDVFRGLNLNIKSLDVNSADLKIDSSSGKSIINLEIFINFSQKFNGKEVKERVRYFKSHK